MMLKEAYNKDDKMAHHSKDYQLHGFCPLSGIFLKLIILIKINSKLNTLLQGKERFPFRVYIIKISFGSHRP
jgi:hypothetical protein